MQNLATEFSISVKGELTGTSFDGVFKARPFLSHRAQMESDKMRRNLIGEKPEEAGEVAVSLAVALSYIFHHLDSAPSWWKDSGNGLNLIDNAPVKAIYDEILRIETAAYKAIQEAGEKAAEALAPKK